jgi:hypothetical protein
MRLKVTVFQGRRHFAWRPVPLEDGRRAWLRFVYRLQPVGGIRPTFRGRPVVYTDCLPYGDPSVRGWLRHSLLGRAWRMRWRLLGYGLLGSVVITALTELIGWVFAWPAAFGGLRVGGIAIYLPGQFLAWRPLLAAGDRWIVDAAAVACIAAAVAIAIRIWLDLTRARRPQGFGTGRWARRADVRRSGLL